MSMMLSISCLLVVINLLWVGCKVIKLEKRINLMDIMILRLSIAGLMNDSTDSLRKKLVGNLGEDLVNIIDKKLKENLDSEVKA